MNAYEELRHAAETAVADLKTGVSDTGFIVRYLQRALKTPRRNCDFGTAEEQAERFESHCGKCNASICDHRLFTDESKVSCVLAWSQMPYEEGETK